MKACSYSTRYKGRKRPKCVGNTFAPCDTCLAKYFRKGYRIRLGMDWKNWRWEAKHNPVGKKGKVLGISRTQGCVRVLFDGMKTPQTFHFSFLERVHGTNKRNRRTQA